MLLIGAGWTCLAAFDLWLLLIRPEAPWRDKIGFVLGLIGVYTFGFAVLSATDILKRLPSLGRNLTSPNPVRFLAGVTLLRALLSIAFALALSTDRTSESLSRRGGLILRVLQTPVVLLAWVLATGFTVVYFLLVAPLAWLAYVVVSALLDSILGAAGDRGIVTVTSTAKGPIGKVMVKELVEEHLVTLRNVLVAVPSLVASLILSAPSVI